MWRLGACSRAYSREIVGALKLGWPNAWPLWAWGMVGQPEGLWAGWVPQDAPGKSPPSAVAPTSSLSHPAWRYFHSTKGFYLPTGVLNPCS